MTLTEFLLDRIAEDEVSAQNYFDYDGYFAYWFQWMKRECETKRLIVAECETAMLRKDTSGAIVAHQIVALLALPHANHPDYQPEWAAE
jgi:hypothetical protein